MESLVGKLSWKHGGIGKFDTELGRVKLKSLGRTVLESLTEIGKNKLRKNQRSWKAFIEVGKSNRSWNVQLILER